MDPSAAAAPGRVDLLAPRPSAPVGCLLGEAADASLELPPLRGISWDSRTVQPGDLFVALRGARHDGHHHLAEAAARGAVAAIAEASGAGLAVPVIVVRDSRRALSGVSAALFDQPARSLRMAAVTGTDGKTTTTHLARSALSAAGLPAAAVSTLCFLDAEGRSSPNGTDLTTPEAPLLHRFLAEQRGAGAAVVVVEATSHALVQRRLTDCRFEAAAVTNLTAEHLDFHGSFGAYAAAKLQLLELLGSGAVPGTLATHAEDPELARFRERWEGPRLDFGLSGGELRARRLDPGPEATSFDLCLGDRRAPVRLPLAGTHNVLNALAAAAIAIALGAPLAGVAEGLQRPVPLPGRLQRVDEGQPFGVVVDFAHTPHALEEVLASLRQSTSGRILVVMGSAGGRDARKRPAMGRAVAAEAALVLLTADDPRDEDPREIAEQIRGGMGSGPGGGCEVRIIPDRRAAIAAAIAAARAGDTVLIAGKGGQVRMYLEGGRTIPWDDAAEAAAALRAAGHRRLAPSGPV